MKLYMVRHGQSTANAGHLHAGWSQIPLTEQGVKEAQQAGKLLAGLKFDRVYVSDLLRAQQTLATALPGIKGEVTPLLREINVGELAGKTADECLEIYGESYLDNKAVHDFTPYGGEDDAMHLERIRRFAVRLVQEKQPLAAAFCHEGSIRCMLDLVLGYRHCRKAYPLTNGSVSVFEYSDKKWALVEWNRIAE